MFDFLTQGDMITKVFGVCALAGTLFFVLRLGMMLIGGDFEDGDVGGDDWSDSTDAAFELVSINTITAFIMMFGWAGLSCYLQFSLGPNQSLIIAVIVGFIAMLITAYLFQIARGFVHKGAELNPKDLVGLNAEVYQTIPAEGSGKVTVSIPGKSVREFEAISADKVELKSFTNVVVVDVVNLRTLSVRVLDQTASAKEERGSE